MTDTVIKQYRQPLLQPFSALLLLLLFYSELNDPSDTKKKSLYISQFCHKGGPKIEPQTLWVGISKEHFVSRLLSLMNGWRLCPTWNAALQTSKVANDRLRGGCQWFKFGGTNDLRSVGARCWSPTMIWAIWTKMHVHHASVCYFCNDFLLGFFSRFFSFLICELFENLLLFVTLNLSSLSSQPSISPEFSRVPPIWGC